jgi:putative DNA primase/helicase
MEEPRPLYSLPDLLQANCIFICEGEKAADAVRSLALVGTTSAHGCESASKTDWTPLAGKEVVVLPDNDPPGEKYANAVVGILSKLTPPTLIKLVRLPNLPEHGDAADWVAAGGTPDELIRLVDAADVWSPTLRPEPGPIITCLADIEPREVAWLWQGRIPLGRITLLVGRPGEGKSFLTTDMAARVTSGTPWPDGSDCPQGSVVFIAAEDDPADTIRPRLDAHGADVGRLDLSELVMDVTFILAKKGLKTLAPPSLARG